MKKIFLNNLPKRGNGNNIDWVNSIGYSIEFIYKDIDGIFIIKEYNPKTKKITLLYDNNIYKVDRHILTGCNLGGILKLKTSNFKIKIGQTFKDNKRDLTIIDREYRGRYKYYKYKCNKCSWDEGWIEESSLLNLKTGCSCCYGRTVVKGINDISTTNPEMVKYFVNIEDAYTHTYCSNDKVLMKCPNCNNEKINIISTLYYQGFSCPECSDGISYPEKVMYNLLKQLNVNFTTQYSKTNTKWCSKYRYDFYFEYSNEQYIIETHGEQHYEEGFSRCGGKTLEQIQENDKNKYNLAIENGIKPENYIIIDCRYSELEFIKNNILHSRLNKIFNLDVIDWIRIGQDSEKSLVKEVCDYWHINIEINKEKLTSYDVAKKFNLTPTTIIKYLKKGTQLGWCNYNAKEELKKWSDKNHKKKIEIFKDNISFGVFESIIDLERQSEELFGVKLFSANICRILSGKTKATTTYKGFTFKYFC